MTSKLNKFHSFMHIGQHIKKVMRQQGVTATQLAKDICCARPHIHRIFRKDNIDIALLERISTALNYDFFGLMDICKAVF